jgi:hypothetical protein
MAEPTRVKQGVGGGGQAGRRRRGSGRASATGVRQGVGGGVHSRRRGLSRAEAAARTWPPASSGQEEEDDSLLFFIFIRILIILTCGAPIHVSKRFSFLPHQPYSWVPPLSIRDQYVFSANCKKFSENLRHFAIQT